MKKLLILFLLYFANDLQAQIQYKGFVYDSLSKAVLNTVRIENLTTHEGTFTNNIGYFEIEAKENDFLVFSMFSYKNKIIQVSANDNGSYRSVFLKSAPIMLKDITIKKGPTQYQQDSARRASIYQDVFEYEQQKSVMSPVTSIYQKFSKKHKNTRKFKNQIVNNEFQKFIDTRYTKELVIQLTKLSDEEAQTFINAYPMEYQYARTASELEIKMWIKYNFLEYSKRKK
ncbi:MAG: carboxypeptidase-like regulatory domain-containing protein [Bacteroidetes bacterium]|nr:carboxypeptidase-like regulatory domain-containing protein [Bacteroidota bacterium]HQW45702.1 carboxypeptidase-like regulatory domain-containing protein [Chitinophagaceae bacterium]